MELNNIKKIYFIGIGGIGMSALARYFKKLGAQVSGYDKTPTILTEQLELEGISVHFEDDVNQLMRDADLVVYTPAIPKNHSELNFYLNNNYVVKKRSEVLGIISRSQFAVCVAGSHGKTTVSSMIAHILLTNGYNVSAFLGGILSNYNSNYLTQKQASAKPLKATKGKPIVVIEADEFDRSFHQLNPEMAVITAVDTDHLDIYGTKEKIDEAFLAFTNKISEDGFLAVKEQQSINESLPETLDKAFYSLSGETSDVFCKKYWVVEGGYVFTISYFGSEYAGFRLNIGGFHNIENALAAFTICKELGLENSEIKNALATFNGIKRRFEKIYDNGKLVMIDDYAHHPEEIRVFVDSVKEMYPDKKITAVFQPHLFSRTKDLAEGFAKALSVADEVILLDIYPARELPIEGVTSQLILDKITSPSKRILSKEETYEYAKTLTEGVFLTIGAGDIDTISEKLKVTLD